MAAGRRRGGGPGGGGALIWAQVSSCRGRLNIGGANPSRPAYSAAGSPTPWRSVAGSVADPSVAGSAATRSSAARVGFVAGLGGPCNRRRVGFVVRVRRTARDRRTVETVGSVGLVVLCVIVENLGTVGSVAIVGLALPVGIFGTI